jgi:hypothetical protein
LKQGGAWEWFEWFLGNAMVVLMAVFPALWVFLLITDPRLSLAEHRPQAILGFEAGLFVFVVGGIAMLWDR